MNIRRFAARTSREAMSRVREAFGDDAIVLHTQPCEEGVEVVAMSPDDVQAVAQASARAPRVAYASSAHDEADADPAPARVVATARPTAKATPAAAAKPSRAEVQGDVDLLSMTTLSFQDYVRQRMRNKRRRSNGDSLFAPSVTPEPGVTEPVKTAAPSPRSQARPASESAHREPVRPAARSASPKQDAASPRAERSAVPKADPRLAFLEETRIEPRMDPVVQPTAVAAAPTTSPLIRHEPTLEARHASVLSERKMRVPATAAAAFVSAPGATTMVLRPVPSAQGDLVAHESTRVPSPSIATAPAAVAPSRVSPVSPVSTGAGVMATRDASTAVPAAPVARRAMFQPEASPVPDAASREQEALMRELRSMKGMIEERFGALTFMDGLQRDPRRAQLAQRLLDAGFSMGMIKALSSRLPAAVSDEAPWVALELERQLRTASLDDESGVFALVGPTGVGKTSCIAKIASAFVARHGASQLGLVTLDTQRPGGHEGLRAQGRALGVPVHVAHDRASLDDLLALLGGKKLVLIDTAGVAPRSPAAADLLLTVGGPEIHRLLVVSAPTQGESIEDCVGAFGMSKLHGALLTKVDEAVKLGPALDVLIRHHVRLYGTTHGQRLGEDWRRADARRLLQRALRGQPATAWRADSSHLGLMAKSSNDAAVTAPGPLDIASKPMALEPMTADPLARNSKLGPRAAAFLAQAR